MHPAINEVTFGAMPSAQDRDTATECPARITIVGTLPPLKAISGYCEGLAMALARRTRVEFLSFQALYPAALYPGRSPSDDSQPTPRHENLQIFTKLAWYNPFSWLSAGLHSRGEVVSIQWWSLPVAPMLLTIALLARLRGRPVATTVHNVIPHAGKGRLFTLFSRLLFALSDLLIVHSEHNAGALRRRYALAPERVAVLPMGAADFAHGRDISRSQARRHLSLPGDRRVLLLFGALRGYKGWDIALEALPAIRDAHPNALLLIAGESWEPEEHYRARVRDIGVTGHVRLDLHYIPEPDIHLYFSAADMVLLPYRHFEAQSGAGVSALSYGLPLVVSDCGSLPELVRDRASVVPTGDAATLAQRISEILASPLLYAKLAADSSELAAQHSWDESCRRLCQLLSQLIPSTDQVRPS